ncbi:hypothetical protein PtA15_9A437 [Puccinia triticina]|uniref:No apical meristem-associated C-terminal domain-containing protein n=1 Tax=Puccinia triticina TaxID=208348 RepID=A0ABY7CX10_9BASI|nr:uncharacterized protein PtA15_9A437 [Puccinia triticina]WAQ88310.1 hypothetical protein PtA15_9A437 [Puccinia triticina]WAR60488.1 hypothetical protein PtB15_9B427 [Puccinia triticina]
MNSTGITHRDTKGVRQKIADLQSSYNSACDFMKNTGEGILEADEINGVRTVEDRINKLCRYWSILDPIMGSRLVTEPLHIRSSVGGDQPGRQDSSDVEDDNPPAEPSARTTTNNTHSPNPPTDGSDLPELSSLMPRPRLSAHARTPAPSTQKKKHKRNSTSKRPATQTRSSRNKRNNTEELYMMSIVSKRQANITRARAKASKIKVSYMKELREHGLSLEEIKTKTSVEFPPLPDMDDGKNKSNEEDSDDLL